MYYIKKSALFFLLFTSVLPALKAQEVVLEQKPDQFAHSNFGANKAWFAQLSIGFGTLVGKGDNELSINDWRSNDLTIGIKMKRKINGLLSVWLEPGYHYAAYNINQTDHKITDSLFWQSPGPLKHVKERFATEGILVNAFLRINIDPKRGNYLGNYLDLGAGSEIIIDREYLAIDQNSDGSVKRTSFSNIPYMNSFGYNVFARIGLNWLAITFNYRLSALFKSQYNIPEPSVFTAGIEINPYTH